LAVNKIGLRVVIFAFKIWFLGDGQFNSVTQIYFELALVAMAMKFERMRL